MPLVSKHFDHFEVEVHSTDVQRTIDSAEGVVTGMFKGYPNKRQFVDIHILDASNEIMTPNSGMFPILDIYMQNATETPDYQNWYQTKAVPLIAKLEAALGTPVTSMDSVYDLFDCATVHRCHNMTIPFSEQLAAETESVYTDYYIRTYSFPTPAEFGRYSIGPLLQVIQQRMQNLISGGKSTKLYLSAGHDIGPILSFLVAMELPVTHWPSYASMITLELWQAGNREYFVRSTYDGEVQIMSACLDDTGVAAEGLCSWVSFQAMVQAFQPPK